METHGRHIMINCEGEGNNPPASASDFILYVAKFLRERHPGVEWYDVDDAIRSYEKGER